MIIIPERELVVITPPRTGSGSLRRALAARYPRAMLMYSHMEADGIPAGYERWKKVGLVRNPLERLWSLYKYCRQMPWHHGDKHVSAIRASVDRSFDSWLLNNSTIFTQPQCEKFLPYYSVKHPLPETRKSQFMYLRPDLGTEVFTYEERDDLFAYLDVTPSLECHKTEDMPMPTLSSAAVDHLNRFHLWDVQVTTDLVMA